MAEEDTPQLSNLDLPIPVKITRCENNESVDALLVELTAKLARQRITGAWWADAAVAKSQRNAEGDHHWDWGAEVGKHRNRGWLVPDPVFRNVGKTLVRWTAYHSDQLGFGGRIVLATLPSPRTVAFYESLGFEATSAEEDDMVIYELRPEKAKALVEEF